MEAGGYFPSYSDSIILAPSCSTSTKKGVVSLVTIVIFPLLEGKGDSQGKNRISLIERNETLKEPLRASLTSPPPPLPTSILSNHFRRVPPPL